jgi:hypothetical protein
LKKRLGSSSSSSSIFSHNRRPQLHVVRHKPSKPPLARPS